MKESDSGFFSRSIREAIWGAAKERKCGGRKSRLGRVGRVVPLERQGRGQEVQFRKIVRKVGPFAERMRGGMLSSALAIRDERKGRR